MTHQKFKEIFGESVEECLAKCKNVREWGGSCNCMGCRFKRQMADPGPAHSPDTAYAKDKMAHHPENYILYNGFVLWCL